MNLSEFFGSSRILRWGNKLSRVYVWNTRSNFIKQPVIVIVIPRKRRKPVTVWQTIVSTVESFLFKFFDLYLKNFYYFRGYRFAAHSDENRPDNVTIIIQSDFVFSLLNFSWNFLNFPLSNLHATGSDRYDDRIAWKYYITYWESGKRRRARGANEDGWRSERTMTRRREEEREKERVSNGSYARGTRAKSPFPRGL